MCFNGVPKNGTHKRWTGRNIPSCGTRDDETESSESKNKVSGNGERWAGNKQKSIFRVFSLWKITHCPLPVPFLVR